MTAAGTGQSSGRAAGDVITAEDLPAPGPLHGIRVVEIAGIGPSPYAAMILAELGADVVRVDRPGGAALPQVPHDALTRSRPNLTLDLKHPQAPDVLLRLVRGADVLLEGLRPGVTERLGIGPAECFEVNPGLVYARMTGWGQDGPLAARAGHDITYAAITGALHVTGGRDKPRQAANLVADFGGGSMFLVVGVLAALVERARSGAGQIIDAAMVDGAASLLTMIYGLHAHGAWRDEREANLIDGGAPFYDTYRCRDGGYVAVGAIEPQFFAELLKGLDLAFDQSDEASWPAMRAAFTAAFADRTRDEWARLFEDTDACVAPVLSLAEAPSHPHMAARGVFQRLANGHEPRIAPRFSRSPGRPPGPVRTPGQDTRQVLLDAGFSPTEIDEMRRAGVLPGAGRRS